MGVVRDVLCLNAPRAPGDELIIVSGMVGERGAKLKVAAKVLKVALTFARLMGVGKDALGAIRVQILAKMIALVMLLLEERMVCVHPTVAWFRTNECMEVLRWELWSTIQKCVR